MQFSTPKPSGARKRPGNDATTHKATMPNRKNESR